MVQNNVIFFANDIVNKFFYIQADSRTDVQTGRCAAERKIVNRADSIQAVHIAVEFQECKIAEDDRDKK
jgi:hypothetical protein